MASGAASPIPLLIGTNHDEANTWLAQNQKIDAATDWDIVEKGLKALRIAAPLPADAEAKWQEEAVAGPFGDPDRSGVSKTGRQDR